MTTSGSRRRDSRNTGREPRLRMDSRPRAQVSRYRPVYPTTEILLFSHRPHPEGSRLGMKVSNPLIQSCQSLNGVLH